MKAPHLTMSAVVPSRRSPWTSATSCAASISPKHGHLALYLADGVVGGLVEGQKWRHKRSVAVRFGPIARGGVRRKSCP
eukprot:925151-Pleurochrysis_carterae.AAC.1